MTIRQLLLALRARPRIFILIVLLTVLSATAVVLLIPKTYVATASLLVDGKDEQSMSNGNGNYLPPRMQVGYLQTQMDIITSLKVLRQVVQKLKLAEDPAAQEAFVKETGGAGSIEEWLAKDLLERLKVDSSQSSVMQIIFKSSNPRFAAQVANEVARTYIDTTLELRVEPTRQTAAWFDGQLKNLRNTLEEAQGKLAKYQQEKGITATEERLDIENARLAELSTQVVQVQNLSYAAGSKERLARSVSSGAVQDQVPEVLASPFIQALKTDLLRGESKLQELSTQLGVKHPQYQRQESENRSLREKIDAEMRKIVEGVANSAHQTRQHEAQLASALAAQRARVLELKQHRNEVGVLMRDVETAQKSYDAAMQRFTISKVDSGATRTNVTLLDPAVPPSRPAHPRVLLSIALAAVVGTMIALGVVYLMEQADRRVRSLDDLVADFDVPLIAQLNSWQPAPRLLERAHNRDWALPAPR